MSGVAFATPKGEPKAMSIAYPDSPAATAILAELENASQDHHQEKIALKHIAISLARIADKLDRKTAANG